MTGRSPGNDMSLDPSQLIITDEILAEDRKGGYWRSPKLLSDDEIESLRQAVDSVCRGERADDTFYCYSQPHFDLTKPNVRQLCNAWWVNHTLRDFLRTPIIGSIAAQFMGTHTVRLWHDQAIVKPGVGSGGSGVRDGNVGWHQDYAHWQCANTTNFCTAWIALQDTDLSNGGMRTIVGSHRWGLSENAYTFGEKDLDGLKARFAREDRPWIDEPCVLKAGEVSFHHALTFHGSGPNLTMAPRLCYIMHMMPHNCGLKRSGLHHPNAGFLGPLAKEGQLFEGDCFPTIWQNKSLATQKNTRPDVLFANT